MAGFLTSFWDRAKEIGEVVDGVTTTVIIFEDSETADEAYVYAQDEDKFFDAVTKDAQLIACKHLLIILWPIHNM